MELNYEVLPIDNIFDSPENWQKLNSFSDDELCRMLVNVAKSVSIMFDLAQQLKQCPKNITQDDIWKAYTKFREIRKHTDVYHILDSDNPQPNNKALDFAYNDLYDLCEVVCYIKCCMENLLRFASYETIAKRYFGQTGEWLSEKCEKALCLILSFTPEECDILAEATIDVQKKAIAYRDAMIALVEKRGLEVY